MSNPLPEPVVHWRRVFSTVSASSFVVPNHVTPSVQHPPIATHPTSLKPSKACGPGHCPASDGHRVVIPASEKANLDSRTLVHVACAEVRLVRAASGSPAGL